jgi:hypothetical protein
MAEENIVSMAAASWKSDVSEVSLDLGLELEQEFIVVDELSHTQQVRHQLLGFVAATVLACPSIGLRALEEEALTRSSPIP